jgi:ABC-type Mn2+/Zn2+ transport system permease subunit
VDWLTDPFALDILQRTLIAGLLTALAGAVVGTWVVIRGLTFMGDALAHGVLPGIAVAVLLDINPVLGAAASALIMVVGVRLVADRSRLPEDVGIGLLFVGMLALAVVIISRSATFATDLTGALFGDVLGVTTGDLWFQAAATTVCVAVTVIGHRAYLAVALSPDRAALSGFRPRRTDLVLLGLVALTVVAGFQAVGSLLVFGLLIGPPAAASLVARRIPAMMVLAALLGGFAVVAGMVVSYHADTATGATISGLAVLEFFVVLTGRDAVEALRRRRPRSAVAAA